MVSADAIALATVGIMLIEGMWLAYLTFMMYRRAEERRRAVAAEAQKREHTVLEDVFLLHRFGLLIKHYTRRLRPAVDSDLLGSMLVAVQEFVKDSFRGESGQLDEIKFGELRIIVVQGLNVVVAAVVKGERPEDLVPQITAAVADIEGRYWQALKDWDGTTDGLKDLDTIMERLLSGGYAHALAPAKESVRRKEALAATAR